MGSPNSAWHSMGFAICLSTAAQTVVATASAAFRIHQSLNWSGRVAEMWSFNRSLSLVIRGCSFAVAFAAIILTLGLSVVGSAFGSVGVSGAPVPTVTCGTPSSDTNGFSVDVEFNELVTGVIEEGDFEISTRSDVFAFWLSVTSHGPHGGFDSWGLSSNFYWLDSNGSLAGLVTDEELDVTFRLLAGAVVDFSGEPNTASNTLHVSVNRKVSVGDASATEGTDGTVDFEVTLGSRNDCETVTVDWSTADGTATAGDDYTADSGTLTFGPGETTKTVSIAVLDDSESEGEESFTLELSNASRATIADTEATGTISDDASDGNTAPTGLPTISGTARVGETLTGSRTGIADDDGLTNATFEWQWIANDGTTDTDIADATASTYTLTAAEAGKTIKVRVTFTDDAGTEEALVSAATEAVAAASERQVASDTEAPTVTVTSDATGPVTGEFEVTVTFSEPVSGFAMSELSVTNGSAARMLSNGDGSVHTVTIRPDPGVNGTITVQVRQGWRQTRPTTRTRPPGCSALGWWLP